MLSFICVIVCSLFVLSGTESVSFFKSGPGFLTLHVMVFVCVFRLTLGVIVRFVELTTV